MKIKGITIQSVGFDKSSVGFSEISFIIDISFKNFFSKMFGLMSSFPVEFLFT